MTYIIAEIGINHNGDLELAKQLIDLAVEAGCNAVKFQKRTVDVVYSQEYLSSSRESPWGTTQRDQKEGLEFSLHDYDIIDLYCKEKGIDWFASSWDIQSQELMRKYNFKFNKVASAMATNLDFVRCVASEKRHTFVSTGMMDLADIDKTVQVFVESSCPFTLLHTVSTYPSLEEDLNLKCIQTLGTGTTSLSAAVATKPVYLPLMAVMLGAQVIEQHLNRTMYGSDQAASLEPVRLNSWFLQSGKFLFV